MRDNRVWPLFLLLIISLSGVASAQISQSTKIDSNSREKDAAVDSGIHTAKMIFPAGILSCSSTKENGPYLFNGNIIVPLRPDP